MQACNCEDVTSHFLAFGGHPIDQTNGVFKAECNGRVKLNGLLIEVLDIYQIQVDIGSESDNADHAAALEISGGVLSEFKVSAHGDIARKIN